MAQLISISLNDETAELVEKLKAKDINISKAFCTALLAYWKKKLKEEAD
jgi:post-segregation antitoxin (ccd killing protein)